MSDEVIPGSFACSSPFGNLANFPLVHIRDFYQFVDQEIVIAGFQDVLDYGSNTIPLFVAGQATFAQNDQSWVHLDIHRRIKSRALLVTTTKSFSKA